VVRNGEEGMGCSPDFVLAGGESTIITGSFFDAFYAIKDRKLDEKRKEKERKRKGKYGKGDTFEGFAAGNATSARSASVPRSFIKADRSQPSCMRR
jgi:hypothetical protein